MRAAVAADAPHALTLASMREGAVRVALGTIFTEHGGDPAKDRAAYRDSDDVEGAHRAGLLQLEWYESMERAGDIAIIRTRRDLARAAAGDPPSDVDAAIVDMEPTLDAWTANWGLGAPARESLRGDWERAEDVRTEPAGGAGGARARASSAAPSGPMRSPRSDSARSDAQAGSSAARCAQPASPHGLSERSSLRRRPWRRRPVAR